MAPISLTGSTTPLTTGRVDVRELVQAHDNRHVFQLSPDDLPAIDVHSP